MARFLSLDPLAAEFAEWSAYNYVLGNPVMLVDSDGKSPEPPSNWTVQDVQKIARLSSTVQALENEINVSTWQISKVSDKELSGHGAGTSQTKKVIVLNETKTLDEAVQGYIWELTNASNQAQSYENTVKAIFGMNNRDEFANTVMKIESEAAVNQNIAVKEINDSGEHTTKLKATVPITDETLRKLSSGEVTKEEVVNDTYNYAKVNFKNMFETYKKQYDYWRQVGENNNLNPENYEEKKDNITF